MQQARADLDMTGNTFEPRIGVLMHISVEQVAESIVVIAETLRRLECRFGVWRFGGKGKNGCRILKSLDQPFDHLIGQRILEGFSYNEGTYPASNLESIAKAVWPEDSPASSSAKQTHRIVLMILDGATQLQLCLATCRNLIQHASNALQHQFCKLLSRRDEHFMQHCRQILQ